MEKSKKSTKKRIVKWVAGLLIITLLAIISIPILFKDKIVELVATTANNNMNATLTYSDSDLSIFSNFPSVSLDLKNVAVVNKVPFLGDTLYSAEHLYLSMGILELFKKNEPIKINSITSENGFVNIIINENNIGNYDIAIKDSTETKTTEKSTFSFDINSYELKNMAFKYDDKSTNNRVLLDSIYHTGNGNFAKDIFNLDTETTGNFSLTVNNVNFLNNVKVRLDALLAIDLNNSKYTFKENKGFINQLPLEFEGFIQLVDENQLYDLQFKTPTSSFKNAIALFPKEMTGNLDGIKTEGNFDLNGFLKGTLSETTIPKFTISILSKDAMFQYSELPKAVRNISLDAKIINETGNVNDTYLSADKLSFKIDEDVFNANARVFKINTNPEIALKADGVINLANISKVYPVTFEKQLEGILTANVAANFDMNSVKKQQYQNIKNSGKLSVRDFKYDGTDVANPFYINKTALNFNTNTIELTEFDAKTGSSDLNLQGNLNNFYGFLFDNKLLKGNFSLSSNTLKVDDFLTKSTEEQKTENTTQLKIPSFLDINLNAKANQVIYDNITLKNVSGNLAIKDETVTLNNINSSVFGGNIGFTGNVSTKGEKPSFSMDLNLKELNISDSFSNLEMLKSIAPIAKTIEGKINSTVNVSGFLNESMTPNLQSITGKLFGELLNTKLKSGNSKALSLLDNKLSFLDADKLNLDNLKGYFSFENGIVEVKPIPINYKDIGITIGGSHGFDNSMNYDININLPVKYLGEDVVKAIQKLTPKDAEDIKTIPVKASLMGSFSSPNFSSNLSEATSNLMKTIVEKQKQNLTNQGKDKLKDLLGLDAKKDSVKKDSVQKPKDLVKDKAKDVLKGLFGKKKKDTVKSN